MVNYHLTISGRVQGVGFRWACYRLAQELGVSGYVKNLANGDVYLEVQGEPETVARFISQVKNGPTPYALISHVEEHAAPCQDYGGRFIIHR